MSHSRRRRRRRRGGGGGGGRRRRRRRIQYGSASKTLKKINSRRQIFRGENGWDPGISVLGL
jgi:hypothetical protein